MKKSFLIVMVLTFFCATQVDAQASRRFRRFASQQTQASIVRNYVDSLAYYKAKLDSVQQENERITAQMGYSPNPNGRMYRLFAPLTFYHSPAQRQLRLLGDGGQDDMLAGVDNALMKVYLNRPDLVENSERRLSLVGTVAEQVDEPIRQDVELALKVEDPQVPDSVPVDVMVEKPNFWTFKGDYYLQFLQNYISGNWYKGGESNYAMLGSATIEANYNNKQKVKWDNKLEMKLGFQTSKADSLHSFKTSEDLLRLSSKLGLQATKRWYYTAMLIAETQFMRGYKNNDIMVYSDFFSPFKLNISLGMDYTVEAFNKKLTGNIHLAPVAYNMKYVDRRALVTIFGLDEGKHVLHDIGSQITAELEWNFTDNIKWKTRFYTYTTYKRVEMEWENTFSFKFNKYISSNLFLYPRFDDNTVRDDHHGYWQFKEFMSIGFSYSF
ncbi:MAG: DUF3078 domain-containing protein [Prevotella sp.]|nr:DUF3078 domain-containing protein [Prevotella sp.]